MASSQEHWISRLFDESGRDLLRFLSRRLGNPADAQELAQEVYLRLLRVQDPTPIRNRRAFALRVAANVAHEWRMLARNRCPHSSESLEEQVSQLKDPFELTAQAEDMKCLGRALDSLSPICRAVVLMHKRDGMTFEQIARVIGYSVPMVRWHLAKGLNVCQDFLASSLGKDAR